MIGVTTPLLLCSHDTEVGAGVPEIIHGIVILESLVTENELFPMTADGISVMTITCRHK